jgi:hypothetical protein
LITQSSHGAFRNMNKSAQIQNNMVFTLCFKI